MRRAHVRGEERNIYLSYLRRKVVREGQGSASNCTSQSPKLSKLCLLSTSQGSDRVGIAITGYTSPLQGSWLLSNRILMLEIGSRSGDCDGIRDGGVRERVGVT